MVTITNPLTEEEILVATTEEATAEQIKEYLETKPQCCVDSRCGCS